VVRRFGRVLDEKAGPGLHFFLPWGMDRVDVVWLAEPRHVTVGQVGSDADDAAVTPPGQFLTGDHNLVNLRVKVVYSVSEDDVAKFVLHADRVDGILQRLTENALAAWVGGRTIEDALFVSWRELPAWLADELRRQLPAYDLGIEIGQLPTVEPSVPREVKPAFDAVAQAETEMKTQIIRAGELAARRVSDANGQDYAIRQQIKSYQNQKREQAQAEADVFEKELAMAAKNPHYRTARWWSALGGIFTQLKGRVEPLDHYLTPDGSLNITTTPLAPRKK